MKTKSYSIGVLYDDHHLELIHWKKWKKLSQKKRSTIVCALIPRKESVRDFAWIPLQELSILDMTDATTHVQFIPSCNTDQYWFAKTSKDRKHVEKKRRKWFQEQEASIAPVKSEFDNPFELLWYLNDLYSIEYYNFVEFDEQSPAKSLALHTIVQSVEIRKDDVILWEEHPTYSFDRLRMCPLPEEESNALLQLFNFVESTDLYRFGDLMYLEFFQGKDTTLWKSGVFHDDDFELETFGDGPEWNSKEKEGGLLFLYGEKRSLYFNVNIKQFSTIYNELKNGVYVDILTTELDSDIPPLGIERTLRDFDPRFSGDYGCFMDRTPALEMFFSADDFIEYAMALYQEWYHVPEKRLNCLVYFCKAPDEDGEIDSDQLWEMECNDERHRIDQEMLTPINRVYMNAFKRDILNHCMGSTISYPISNEEAKKWNQLLEKEVVTKEQSQGWHQVTKEEAEKWL